MAQDDLSGRVPLLVRRSTDRPDVARRVRPRSTRVRLRGATSVAAFADGTEVMTMWTKVQIIADTGAGLGIVLTLFYSIWSFRTTLRDSYYAELDRVYFDLLQVGLEHPGLLASAPPRDPSQAPAYGLCAF